MSGYLTFDGMCWPDPTDPRELQWKLRYAPQSLSRADQLVMASVLSAYGSLVELDARTRQQRVMQIRAAVGEENSQP